MNQQIFHFSRKKADYKKVQFCDRETTFFEKKFNGLDPKGASAQWCDEKISLHINFNYAIKSTPLYNFAQTSIRNAFPPKF